MPPEDLIAEVCESHKGDIKMQVQKDRLSS